MITAIDEIEAIIKSAIHQHIPPLRIREDSEAKFEVCGRKEIMQGKQKVDGYYFASIIKKPKDVRFYFFPIYTHVDQFDLSVELSKFLKGKSCFHLKKLNDVVIEELKGVIALGVELYSKDDLL